MRRSTALTLLVAAMLLLAGCNNLPSGGTAPPTTAGESPSGTTIGAIDKTTSTDETTRTTQTTGEANDTNESESQLAPGLTKSGVTDATLLADAHAAVLANTSYTAESQRLASNGTGNQNATVVVLSRTNTTTKVAHEPTRVFWRYDFSGNASVTPAFPQDIEVWSGENETFEAVEGQNGTTYRESNGRGVSVASARTGRDTLSVLFGSLNTSVTRTTTQNGTTLYRVNSTGVADNATLASLFGVESASNVSMTALVDSDGLVHEYHVEYDATSGNRTWHVSQTSRFTALGETTVERPPWYDEAVNATATNESSR